MEFERLVTFAQFDPETGATYGIISLAVTFCTWFGVKVLEPGIKERRDRRETEFNAKLDREERIAVATIKEMSERTAEEKKFREDAERKRQEENEKTMLAMEARGARETSHMKALEAVADGQRQNLLRLERMEELTTGELKQLKVAVKAVLRKLNEEFEWDDEDNVVKPATPPAAGQPRIDGPV